MSYSKKFFLSQSVASTRSSERILPTILKSIRPRSVLDIGCGRGGWLHIAHNCGVSEIFGVDGKWAAKAGLLIDEDRFYAHDLATTLDLRRRFDLAMSIEVAEHIPNSSAGIFVDNLCRHSDLVLFSAALPGQGGRSHVNEQPLRFWINKFSERSYVFLDLLRPFFWNDAKIGACYRQNVVLFVHQPRVAAVRAAVEAQVGSRTFADIIDVVHPRLLQERAEYATFSRLVRIKLAVKLLLSVVNNSYRWSV